NPVSQRASLLRDRRCRDRNRGSRLRRESGRGTRVAHGDGGRCRRTVFHKPEREVHRRLSPVVGARVLACTHGPSASAECAQTVCPTEEAWRRYKGTLAVAGSKATA